MRPKLLFTIRTADRSPKTNYIGQTLTSLIRGGVEPADIHIFPTESDCSWLWSPVMEGFPVYAPEQRRTPNENGLAPISLLDWYDDVDWIILSEDDLEWCQAPLEMMAAWLSMCASPDVLVHRFFSFDALRQIGKHVATAPLREQKGSQVIALRAKDARRFAAWAAAHPTNWRPKNAPFQNRPHDGFDKLVGYWALQDRPEVPFGLVSRPFFVKHIGLQSSLHSHGVARDARFSPRPLELAP